MPLYRVDTNCTWRNLGWDKAADIGKKLLDAGALVTVTAEADPKPPETPPIPPPIAHPAVDSPKPATPKPDSGIHRPATRVRGMSGKRPSPSSSESSAGGHEPWKCPKCGKTVTRMGRGAHTRIAHGNNPLKEKPDGVSSSVAHIRLTPELVERAVDAEFHGKSLASWIEAERFRGNVNALTAWVHAVMRSTDRIAWGRMEVGDRQRFVHRAIGHKVDEKALEEAPDSAAPEAD